MNTLDPPTRKDFATYAEYASYKSRIKRKQMLKQLSLFPENQKYILEYTADSYNKEGNNDHIEKTWIEQFETELDRHKVYETIKLMPETYKNIKQYETNSWQEYLAK